MDRGNSRRRAGRILAVTAAGAAFWFRYLGQHGFPDDHFIHVARAQQWLTGQWPVLHFSDFGAPLTAALSAVAIGLAPAGAELFAEALLTFAGFGLAAGLIAWLVVRMTGSLGWAAFAATLATVVLPRTYAHPKLWIYPWAGLAGAWYLDAPSPRRAAALAALATFAFLLRHDHGLYIGVGLAVMLVAAHYREGWTPTVTRVAQFVGAGLVMILPFLVYLSAGPGGLTEYVRTGLEVNESEGARSRLAWPALRPTLPSALGLEPVAPTVLVNIRWREDLADAEREAIEQSLGMQPHRVLEPHVRQYELPDATVARQQAVITHPAVEDTGNLDRSLRPGWRGFLSRNNAEVMLYYSHFLLSFALVVLGLRRGAATPGPVLVLMGVLGVVSGAGLLRDPLAVRVPDVYGTFAVIATVVFAAIGRAPFARPLARVAAGVLAVVVLAASGFIGSVGAHLYGAGLYPGVFGPRAAAAQATRELLAWPWPRQWPAGEEMWPLARYVHECTLPEDRLLVTWNAPHLFVVTGRPFAGTETVLLPLWRDTPAYEMPLSRRIMQQAPPLALVSTDGWEEFTEEYPFLSGHIERAYVEIGTFPGRPDVSVRALAARPQARVDEETGWPCFAPTSRR